MTATDASEHPGTPRRKHRHDLGQEDHGPKLASGTTRAIQVLLGMWIALTLILLVWALVDATRARGVGTTAPTHDTEPTTSP